MSSYQDDFICTVVLTGSSNSCLVGYFVRGENVEDAFLETAKKIYQNIQDGRYNNNNNLLTYIAQISCGYDHLCITL